MFQDLAKILFAFLVDDYGFGISMDNSEHIVYETPATRVDVQTEYHLVSVLVSSREPEIIRRLKVGMLELAQLRAPELQIDYPPTFAEYNRDPPGCVERQLHTLSRLLRDYGDDLLRGDFSLRREIQGLRRKHAEERQAQLRRPNSGTRTRKPSR